MIKNFTSLELEHYEPDTEFIDKHYLGFPFCLDTKRKKKNQGSFSSAENFFTKPKCDRVIFESSSKLPALTKVSL